MKFKAGYLGLCLVVLALFGSAILGLVANVDKTEVTTTSYDYVTDITGLFDFSDTPQYIEYIPASNYTGYSNTVDNENYPTGLSFTVSQVANNYRVPTYVSTTTTGPSGTINDSTSLTLVPHNTVISGNTREGYSPTGLASNQIPDDYTSVTGYKVSTIYDFCYSVFGAPSGYRSVELNFSYPGVGYPITSAFVVPGLNSVDAPYSYGSTSFHPQITRLVIDPVALTAQAYTGASLNGTYSLYDLYVYYGNATQKTTIYTSDGYGGAPASTLIASTSLSLTYTSTITPVPTYAYLLPSAGVSLAQNPLGGYFSTVWDNDTGATRYLNSRVDIAIHVPNDTGISIDLGTYEFTIRNNGGLSVDGVTLGQFERILFSVDTVAGTVTIRPIITFSNFFDYTTADIMIYSANIQATTGLEEIVFSKPTGVSGASSWQIVNTTVFMDTFNSVMVNPSIDLSDYFPELDSYRYWFQSFALYGESITINGTTYDLDDNHSITIDGATERLNNFYISYDLENNASITFRQTNKTYDLGQAEDRTISFTGIWYFNAGLYEGHSATEEVYKWAGAFEGNADTIIILGLGLLAVLYLGFTKAGYKFKLLDKLVLAVCVVFLVSLIGGLI